MHTDPSLLVNSLFMVTFNEAAATVSGGEQDGFGALVACAGSGIDICDTMGISIKNTVPESQRSLL